MTHHNQIKELTTWFLISFNKLESQIPEGGVFSNISLQSLRGNIGLCGKLRLAFPTCATDSSHSKSRHVVILVIPLAVIGFASLAVCMYLTIIRKCSEEGSQNKFYRYL
jgi:hypothetical protein